jgi:hypothetical protein
VRTCRRDARQPGISAQRPGQCEGAGAAGTHNMSTLTKRLAGPSTAKAGMETVDQAKVNDIIYKASEVDLRPPRTLSDVAEAC